MLFKVKIFPLKSLSYFIILLLVLSSCKKKYDFSIQAPEKLKINSVLDLNITDEFGHEYDSVKVFLDAKPLSSLNNIDLSDEKLGRRTIKAEVYYDGRQKTLQKPIVLYAAHSPKIYDYKVVNIYPHDTKAYTQGLEYNNGYLYESTGQRGESSLRKVEIKTGKVIMQINLPQQYFAEGLTIYDNKIYQLTWQSKKGFIYNLKDFKQVGTFDYKKSAEGWGLTHNGKYLIKTDGTERVWFLNPETLEEDYFIQAYTDKQSVPNLNELEYINGKVYANVYLKNIILILNHLSGVIEGIVDLNSLEQEVRKTQDLIPNDEVLNGIAYDKENDRIFVTGKHWGKLFEIEIFERQ